MTTISELIEIHGRAKQIVQDLEDLIADHFQAQVETDRFIHSVESLGDGFRVVDGELRYSADWLGEEKP